MKRLFFVIVAGIYFFGCVLPKEMTEGTEELIMEEQTIQMSKSEIKIKLLMFVNEGFKSARAVIQTNEDGLLTGMYTTQLKLTDPILQQYAHAEISFMIKYSDNKYKLKMILKGVYSIDKNSVRNDYTRDYWGAFNEEIQKSYYDFNTTLISYMKSTSVF